MEVFFFILILPQLKELFLPKKKILLNLIIILISLGIKTKTEDVILLYKLNLIKSILFIKCK